MVYAVLFESGLDQAEDPMARRTESTADDSLEIYFKQVRQFPLLNFEEELVLSKQAQAGNIEALHKLINSNLRLVIRIAKLYNAFDVSFMDLIQEGNMGLMHAAEKYDHKKNVRFCTYASWWIRQFIARYLANKRRMIRLPHRKEEMLRKIQRTYHTLSQSLMHQPGSRDIAEELGISTQDVDFIINMTASPLPLEMTGSEESNSAVELREDYTYSPERVLLRKASSAGALNILSKLKDREQRVISYRYQLNGCAHHTLREIGDKLGISPETVRQIEIRALQKIRSHADELRENIYTEAM
jgi:RNA polymerase primary sigma factor